MFFDDATQRKPAGRVQLRLAADKDANGPSLLNAVGSDTDAARRHRAARLRREPSGPSILDQIDAISARQAIAEQEERAQAERFALEMEAAASEARQHAEAEKEHNSRRSAQDTQQTDGSRSHYAKTTYDGAAQNQGHSAGVHRDFAGVTEGEDAAPLIDPIYVFRSVRNWRALIAATTMLGGLAGTYIALNTPHLYFSSATVVIDPRNYKVIENDLNPDVFLSEAALAIVDSQVSLMRSPRVLEKVASKLKLANDPEFNGSKQGALGSFFDLLSSSKVEDFDGSALKYLAEHMSAERSPKTFVVNVGAYSEDPEKAALIANTIVDIYLDEQAETRSDLAKRTSGELGSRLESLKAKVEDAESKVEAFRSQNDLFGAQGRLIEDEEILRVNDQLTAARSNTITLNSRAQSAKSVTVDAVASGSLPEEVASNGLTALRAQYVAAKQNRDGLSVKLGPMHPDLQQADKALASLSGAINAEINRIRQSLQTDLKRAVETEQQLAGRLARLKVEQGSSGEAQVQLRELEREAVTARTVYEQYLLRARETGEQGNINANNVQKISEARPADTPEGASRKLIVVGGAIAGFVAGLGLAVAIGMFNALKARFASGDGAPLPSSPNAPQSGSSSRRPIAKVFTGKGEPSPDWSITPKAAPLAAMNWQPQPEVSAQPVMQQPAAAQPVMQQPTALQPVMQQPVPQPPQAYPFAPQVVPQTFIQPPTQQFAPQPVMQQPMPFAPHPAMQQAFAQPLQAPHFIVPQPMPGFAPSQYLHPFAMQQVVQQPMMHAYPLQMQPIQQFIPMPMQPQPIPVPQYVQPAEQAPAPVQLHQMTAPSAQPQAQSMPQPAQPVYQSTSRPDDIQGSLNDLRAELLDIARRRRSA